MYRAGMRRVLLTLLIAVAVSWNGVATALASESCPMQAMSGTPQKAQPHAMPAMDMADCHTGSVKSQKPASPAQPMKGCPMALACLALPSLAAPESAVIVPVFVTRIDQPLLVSAAPPDAMPSEYWRPPRTT